MPAFAEAAGHAIGSTTEAVTDPLTAVVQPSWPQRAKRTAGLLGRAGLTRTGAAVTALAGAVRSGAPYLLDRRADVHLRLLVTAEQL